MKTFPERMLTAPAKTIPVYAEADVVVLGGGPAGITAAVSAARNGMKVILIERYGFLGGMGTAAGVTNFCGLYGNVFGVNKQIVHGIADELLKKMKELNGLNEPHMILGKILALSYDMSAFKCAADEILSSSGVDILFHALATDIMRGEDGNIHTIILETKSGRIAVNGDFFIDCSGDADLAFWSELPFEKGSPEGEMLYPSLMFRIGGVDPVEAGEAWKTIPIIMDDVVKAGKYRFPRRGAIVRPQRNPTEWRANVTQLANHEGQALDGTNVLDLSKGEQDGRQQIVNYIHFLRNEVPGFSQAYLIDIAPQIGVRETRRITGEYKLTADDVIGCADFPDSVGVNGWPLEKHVAGDVIWEWPPIPGSRGYNQLPYRIMLPKKTTSAGCSNLLVAGRCASMTHEAHSAARVTGACFVMGQAAGTAAALALKEGCDAYDVDILKLQALLTEQGAFLGTLDS